MTRVYISRKEADAMRGPLRSTFTPTADVSESLRVHHGFEYYIVDDDDPRLHQREQVTAP